MTNLLTLLLLKDENGASAMGIRKEQGHEKATNAISYSDEEDMIDDEDAPAEAQHATNASYAPQCAPWLVLDKEPSRYLRWIALALRNHWPTAC